MRVFAGAGFCGTGSVAATHTGRGWMGGLVLRMVLAFNVLGRTATKHTLLGYFTSQKNSYIQYIL